MSRLNRQRGKRNERATAKLLDGRRVGTMCGEDVFTARFSIECKSREKLPAFIVKSYEQAIKNNKERDKKVTLLQLHQTGSRHLNDFIVISMKDFLSLLGVEEEQVCQKADS